jgi:hypothetical protein
VYPRTSYVERGPGQGVILGSNDGEHWYKLTEYSGKTYVALTATNIQVNATTPYQYFRMTVNKLVNADSDRNVNVGEWRLFSATGVTKMDNVLISGELAVDGGALQTSHIKWPKVPLKANESEGYVASASSVYDTEEPLYFAYNAFNNYITNSGSNLSPNWQSAVSFNSSGEPVNGTAISFDGMDGEWIQIQMPHKIALSYFTIGRRNDNGNSVNSGYMYGSNDGINWTRLAYFTGITYSLASSGNTAFKERVNVESTQTFSHYRLFITKINPEGSYRVILEELQLFESTLGVGTSATTAKLTVNGGLGLAKGSQVFAGSDVITEFPKHDRPLVKYPEVAMTAASTGGYTATASSSVGGYPAYLAFDGTDSFYITNYGNYDISDGSYTGSNTFEGIPGQTLSLTMPKKIKLQHIRIRARTGSGSDNAPKKARIFGSNDNSTWVQLCTFDQMGIDIVNGTYKLFVVNAEQYYNAYTFVIEEGDMEPGTTSAYVSVAELEYYGHEEGDESVDVVHRSIPNKPSQQQLAVYYEARDPNSYSFADSSNVYDLSGSGVTGTITGNNGFDAEYNAWVFDGSGDYISGTLSNPVGDWSYSTSVWFKVTDLSVSRQTIFHIGTQGTDGKAIELRIGDSTEIYHIHWNCDKYYENLSLSENRWYHACMTYGGGGNEGGNMKLYLDGILLNYTRLYGSGNLNINANAPFVLGSERSPIENEFTGSIANFRLFGKVLNADQVRELYEYDAERFGHRQNVMALHKGNLGVGVTNPTSRFEVAGADGLQEYPPKAMTGYETYMEGHGVFRAYANSEENGLAWKAFNKSDAQGDGWVTEQYQFVLDTGYSNTSTATTNTVFGRCSFLAIETPGLIKLEKIRIQPDVNTSGAPDSHKLGMPKDFQIWARKSGTEWTQIASYADQIFLYLTGSTEYYDVNVNDYYSEFAIVVTRTHTSSSYSWTSGTSQYTRGSIGEWRLFGTPAPSSLEDGHLTLGKALTLPRVSGHPAGAETPRAESLVVHYDTTVDSVVSGSTVVDISGNGLNGTLTGAAYSSTDRALTFDGSVDYVSGTLNNPAGAWVHSVSCWWKTSIGVGTSTYDTIFSIGDFAATEFTTFYMKSNAILVSIYGSGALFPFSLQVDRWYHSTVVMRGTTSSISDIDFYLDGVKLTSSGQFGTATTRALPANASLRLGREVVGGGNHLSGSISNFKLWNVTLTAEEVAMEYALGRTGKSINLTDTALCLGGTVPRAQLDVRGGARFDGYTRIGKYDFESSSQEISKIMLDARGPSRHMGILLPSTLGNNYTHPTPDIDHDSNPPPWEIRSVGGVAVNRYNPNAGDGLLRLRAGYYLQPSWIDLCGYNQAGTSKCIIFGTAGNERMRIVENGNVGIGLTNPGTINTVPDVNRTLHVVGSYVVSEPGDDEHWSISTNNDLIFKASINGDGFYSAASISYATGTYNDLITFTGQHRALHIENIPPIKVSEHQGLIVCANKNEYESVNGDKKRGSDAITINEAIPLLRLSSSPMDKTCFGVISSSEDPDNRTQKYGNFISHHFKMKGDEHIFVNSVGEGAMWVTNINGPLESGDYITTSNVAGYGQRQDDDILHNYTVAKITMDCDFEPPDIPVQRILKELANITYWYQLEDATSNAYDRTEEETYYTLDRRVEVYGHVDEQSNVFITPEHDLELYMKTQENIVSEEVYNALPEDERVLYDSNTFTYTQVIEMSPEVWADLGDEEQNTYVHGYFNIVTDEVPSETPGAVERTRTLYKKIINETKVEPATPEDYFSEVREEWVNVLDVHGQLQWEDVPWGETEPAYKIRYLDADGQITTRHNEVYRAAFVGVTYHCG